jgi:hypothetical protein
MAVGLSALGTGRRFTPQKYYFYPSSTYFCYRLSKSQGIVRPEAVGKLIRHSLTSLRRVAQCLATKLPPETVANN